MGRFARARALRDRRRREFRGRVPPEPPAPAGIRPGPALRLALAGGWHAGLRRLTAAPPAPFISPSTPPTAGGAAHAALRLMSPSPPAIFRGLPAMPPAPPMAPPPAVPADFKRAW